MGETDEIERGDALGRGLLGMRRQRQKQTGEDGGDCDRFQRPTGEIVMRQS
jgi:hypothetical protein